MEGFALYSASVFLRMAQILVDCFYLSLCIKSLLKDTQNSSWAVALETENESFTNVQRLNTVDVTSKLTSRNAQNSHIIWGHSAVIFAYQAISPAQ